MARRSRFKPTSGRWSSFGRYGSVREQSLPDLGRHVHAAVRGDEVWVIGTRAIAHEPFAALGGNWSWVVVPLDSAPATVFVATAIVALDDGVVGVAATPERTLVVTFDASGIAPARSWLGVALAAAVGDGRGGIWAVAPGVGYAHFAGTWTLWATARDAAPEGFAAILGGAKVSPTGRVAPAPDGGAYIATDAGPLRIAPDGALVDGTVAIDTQPAVAALDGCGGFDPPVTASFVVKVRLRALSRRSCRARRRGSATRRCRQLRYTGGDCAP